METLQAIESIVLFSFVNYFLLFSEAYKRIYYIQEEMDNDWYVYAKYGTINRLIIFLQRKGSPVKRRCIFDSIVMILSWG